MRFKLTLEVNKTAFGNILPINYQYEQSALIYRILGQANLEYSTWLHDNGFELESGKRFKLFLAVGENKGYTRNRCDNRLCLP